jgi:NAD(P)-dependent dehydrogenase (short-subunit alcohol dehydrogenase family)
MKLDGRVALVTGGNRGIGAAIVRLFSAEGARVVFCGRRAELGRSVEEELRSEGREVTYVATDVADAEAARALVAGTVELYGGLNILVNNAGIAPAGTVEAMEVADWDELMHINIRSMFLMSKYAIPELRRAGKGVIINLGSTFGVVGAGGSSGYALTKAAAISFSKSLALELAGEGIRVNALCPGGTDTEFLHEWFESTGDAEGTEEWLVSRHPLGRFATSDEQARGALFLVSDDASFVTGHSLLVDGGYTAQ